MRIEYTASVTAKDIPRLDGAIAARIKIAIEQKLCVNPLHYGTPLSATLKKLWKFRVGDYRVVYSINKDLLTIWGIGHRNNIYKLIENRIRG